MPAKKNKVTIIGGGLSGSLAAIFLARRGYEIQIFEVRPDMRLETASKGRSINMTLAARGVRALEEVGAAEHIMPLTVPLKGRMVHSASGKVISQPYGNNEREVIYAIKRRDLNVGLVNFAESLPNVTYRFNMRCSRIEKEKSVLHLYDEVAGTEVCTRPDLIIGADGTFSAVLQEMQRGERAVYQKDYLNWGYKELPIPPGPDGDFQLDKNALHVWPRGDSMFMAIPNNDGSLTGTFALPFEGKPSFESLSREGELLAFFKERFHDVVPLMPSLVENFHRYPASQFYTTKTLPWYYKDRIVLIGDSCHTVVPFYGQGMNAAFEDCSVLTKCIEAHPDELEKAFKQFQDLRKRNTDALADLSLQNFVDLRDRAKSPRYIARKKVEGVLQRLSPKRYVPLYTLITHSTMPYADALEVVRKRDRLLRCLGIDLVHGAVAAAVISNNLFESALAARRRLSEKYFGLHPLRRSNVFKSNVK